MAKKPAKKTSTVAAIGAAVEADAAPVKKSRWTSVYLIAMTWLSLYWALFVTLELLGAIEPTTSLRIVEVGIVIFFVVDYIRLLIKAPDKWEYVKHNIFALLSIIPVFALLRVVVIGQEEGYWRKFVKAFSQLLRTNGFGQIILLVCMTVFFTTIAFYHTEKGHSLNTYYEAFYNTVITLATVGYGDFAPVTVAGRGIAIFLSFFSIAVIGVITGTLANFFFSRVSSAQTRDEIRSDLELEDLTQKQKQDILAYVNYVRYRSENEPEGIPSPEEEEVVGT